MKANLLWQILKTKYKTKQDIAELCYIKALSQTIHGWL